MDDSNRFLAPGVRNEVISRKKNKLASNNQDINKSITVDVNPNIIIEKTIENERVIADQS